jgi:endonuclease/exonuclease/phosphatase family metal-dependent hydrolase
LKEERTMMSTLSRLLAPSLLGVATLASAGGIDVMTQNQYLGADLAPVLDAATAVPFDGAAFNTAVVQALAKIAATRPAERSLALAAQIRQRHPDVVGLQEAYEFRCLPYPGVDPMPGRGCDDPNVKGAFTDRLADTVAALRGSYAEAGRVTNLRVAAIPFTVNGFPAVLGLADRDAVLVRQGLPAKAVDLAAAGLCAKPADQGCNYQTAPPVFTTPLGPIAIERGFVAVDVRVKGRDYRVFNTHLEQRLLGPTLPETRLLQVGQAWELVGAMHASWDGAKTVIALGDFNSAPGDTIPVPPYSATLPWAPTLPVLPPYQVLVAGGFTDAWTLRPHRDPGHTCCQDEDLKNRQPALYERIDLVFSLQRPARVHDMQVLGDRQGDKTRPPGRDGLWPSDHAAVAAQLDFD